MKLFFGCFFLLFGSTVFADTVHTCGGGDLLRQVFDAIGKILYGSGETGAAKTFTALVRISLTIGAFCCVCLAFFRQTFEPLIKNFLFPGVVIVGLLLVPTTTVTVVDHHALSEKKENIQSSVPFFLGKFASLTSFSFQSLSDLFANAIGETYPWSSNLSSENNFFRHGNMVLKNPKLEENFRAFCHECTFRDLGLGLYTKAELFQQPDLFAFFEQKTSNLRAMDYDAEGLPEAIPCKEAIRRMTPLFEQEAKTFEPWVLEQRAMDLVPSPQDIKTFIRQKIAIDLMEEEIFGHPSKPQGAAVVSLIAASLMGLRNFFEAVLYLIFPLVLVISLLSFGLRAAIQWIKIVLWVCTWPIFYVAADLFCQAIWTLRLGKEFVGLTVDGLRTFSDRYASMELLACFTLASIPFLSWILIQGSFFQFVHLAASAPSLNPSKMGEEMSGPLYAESPNVPQTCSEMLISEKEPWDNGFQMGVENAKKEEWLQLFNQSLVSIREAVKEASKEGASAIGRSERELFDTKLSHIEETERQEHFGSRMHVPSYGSFVQEERSL